MTELREQVARLISREIEPTQREWKRALEQADAVLAIPAIAEALKVHAELDDRIKTESEESLKIGYLMGADNATP